MSRLVLLACLCVVALPSAILVRQARAAEASAASMAELAFPGAIDPVDAPQDHLDDSISTDRSLDLPGPAPAILDRTFILPDLVPRPSTTRPDAGPAPPPPSARRRLCRLQVFRD